MELSNVSTNIDNTTSKITSLNAQKSSISTRVSVMEEKLNNKSELEKSYENWERKKAELELITIKEEEYKELLNKEINSSKIVAEAKYTYRQSYNEKALRIKELKSKMELLDNAKCIDIEKATCRFLVDAIEAKKQYEPLMEECKTWKESEINKIAKIEEAYYLVKKALDDLNFDNTLSRRLQTEISTLEIKAIEYKNLKTVVEQLEATKEMLTTISIEIDTKNNELENLKNKEAALKVSISELSKSATLFDETQKSIAETLIWVEKERELPVAKEKKSTANYRIIELSKTLTELDLEIASKNSEYEKEILNAMGKDEASQNLIEINNLMSISQEKCDGLQYKIGSLTNQIENIKNDKESIKDITGKIKGLSEKSATLDILKQAFSPDGVPHNIIRAMLPLITTTANSILSQMTGGKMGMEFRTEKVLKSNNKKEVVTLDIFIEEYGKPALPYSSKSGGEKVKSALSAILALAETKSDSVGIRLGMLFIDEPPFLDGDGIQAYCDALETIGQRYKDIKIMAITHDPTMKARFPQNLDVIKTENGSKVIFE